MFFFFFCRIPVVGGGGGVGESAPACQSSKSILLTISPLLGSLGGLFFSNTFEGEGWLNAEGGRLFN